MIGLGGRHLVDLLQSLLGVATHLLDPVAHLLGDADRLLLGDAAELPLHFDERLARLARGTQHLFGTHAENTPRTVVTDAKELRTVRNAEHGGRARLGSPHVARGFHLQIPQQCRSPHRHFRHALQMLGTGCLTAVLRRLRAVLRRLRALR